MPKDFSYESIVSPEHKVKKSITIMSNKNC